MSIQSQADRIIGKFGSAYKLQKALEAVGIKRTVIAIYRWTYQPPKGTGGFVPFGGGKHALTPDKLLEAAKVAGVELTAADMSPLAVDVTPSLEGLL